MADGGSIEARFRSAARDINGDYLQMGRSQLSSS